MTTLFLALGLLAAGPADAIRFEVLSRQVRRAGGEWAVDYRLAGPAAAGADGDRLDVSVSGWVSNSRTPGHGRPIRAATEVSAYVAAGGVKFDGKCRLIGGEPACAEAVAGDLAVEGPGRYRLRIRLKHEHEVHGAWDPLLGARAVEVDLAGVRLSDRLDLTAATDPPRAVALAPIPEDRRDTRYRAGGDYSLHLMAHEPGMHYYRYPDIAARSGSRLRLSFRYLVAVGTEGECRVRVAQYRDTPTSWRMLNDAGVELPLRRVGRWATFERTIEVAPGATTLALDFRIAGDSDVGELWVDGVRLAPPGAPARPEGP